ncbi:NlpC/P60 family protein [Aestuariivirga sp.]|uniref:C40 family peptidase n=1 Tax=Aestuariivirga sp. TaxID=2650926 RepID=UPI0025B8F8DC|nr:NlpC/P60 family protein [Aestuariivirga sp.]MCA3554680.1 C40 family peptidase [Aestuariivirga sp.]
MSKPDARLHAYRPDLADVALAGQVEATRFVEPRLTQVIEPVISLHKAPRFDAMQLTQALFGEEVKLFHEEEGWAWVQLVKDGYVGYVNGNALSPHVLAPSHRVAVPSTFMYPEADLKTLPAIPLSLNAQVTVMTEAGAYSQLSNRRFVFTAHLKRIDDVEADFVAVAAMFRHVPYHWGGKSAQGLDCSGLVQLSLEACGLRALRDSDMQERTLGGNLPVDGLDSLRRGDLVFWNGHVGIMMDGTILLHANGHHMMVVAEPLRDAAHRIAARYGQLTGVRRLPGYAGF